MNYGACLTWYPRFREKVLLSLLWSGTKMVREVIDHREVLIFYWQMKICPSGEHEAIMVGAIGTGAPWFLTGWAEGTEVEFMIDAACQVTILATSVFERMCAADPVFGTRLQPCRCRLVSADSSPLMVRGELDMTVVFSGLAV